MASDVAAALAQCPSTKIIVAGYSQGAMVVHNAFSAQGLKPAQVSGAVLFGDPLIRLPIKDLSTNKTKEFCGSSDGICGQPTGDVNGGHLSYGAVADKAADFIISAAGLA
jgi:cutinase